MNLLLRKFYLVIIQISFLILLLSCNIEKTGTREIIYLNDSRENYTNATRRELEVREDPWLIKQLYECWTDVYVARLFQHEGTDHLVYAYGDWESGFYLESRKLLPEYTQTHYISGELQFKWSSLDNFRLEKGNVHFYTSDDSSYYFSLDSLELISSSEYPYEKVDWVNSVISPDRNYQVYWNNNTIYLKNLQTQQNEIVWDDPGYDGTWSIGDVVWSQDGKRLYLDNSGGAACIWELDLEQNTLTKIVPDHDAIHPVHISKNGYDYILYIQSNYIRMATNNPDAEGFIDPSLIESENLVLPLEIVTEKDTLDFLEMMPYKSEVLVASLDHTSDYEDFSVQTKIWRVGTIMDEPYQAGILWREEGIESYKGGSEYWINRYIKLQDKLILLPQSSSSSFAYLREKETYTRNVNNPLTFSELFSGITEIKLDYSVSVEGIFVPDTLINEPGKYSVMLGEEVLLNKSDEPVYKQISDPEELMDQLTEIGHHDILGKMYIEADPSSDERHPAFEHRGGGLFFFTKDNTLLNYRLIPEFSGHTIIDPDINLQDYEWITDYAYVDDGSGWKDLACVYTEADLFDPPGLAMIGSTSSGDTLWGPGESRHHVIQKELDRIHESSDAFDIVQVDYPETYDDFILNVSIFFWKDPFGRYIRFIDNTYMTPLLAEPIIYLYSDNTRNYTVALDEKIEIVSTWPEIHSEWNIYGTETGQVILSQSGKKYNYLFWEGYAGIIPTPSEGFVVEKQKVPDFLDHTLIKLGLIEKEIEDFKEAWLPEFLDAPWYFITFYEQEIIDLIAPLHIDPAPETIIRILMDYQPLNNPIEVYEPSFSSPPARNGTTLVEWGGLKRQ